MKGETTKDLTELLHRCRAVATSTWSDALDQMGLPGVIYGLTLRSGEGCIAGPALTVRELAGLTNSFPLDAFVPGKFIDAIYPGAILAIEMDGAAVSTFGGLAAQAAARNGAAGVLIDGGCRDIADVRSSGLWLSSRHVTPVSGKGRVKIEAINVPVTLCGVRVNPGDIIVGDETGVVSVSSENLPEVLDLAERLTERDLRFSEGLGTGASFGDTAARLHHV